MTTPTFGPPWRIDGPLPLERPYGLLGVANSQHPAVRVVPDVDAQRVERWINGVALDSYPPSVPEVWNACAPASELVVKAEGGVAPMPEFGALVVYVAETCTSRSIFGGSRDQDAWVAAFRDRATRVLAAVESSILEHEFLSGAVLPLNPHLADANTGWSGYADQGILNAGAATSPANGLALLEDAIAQSGRMGVIHTTPGFVVGAAGVNWHDFDTRVGCIRTINGTPVVAGAGYAIARSEGVRPHGTVVVGSTEEWIYASGPIEVRRSEVFTIPEATPDALAGAVDHSTNTITYRAERYYLIDWDTAVQAAVLVDRCQTTC